MFEIFLKGSPTVETNLNRCSFRITPHDLIHDVNPSDLHSSARPSGAFCRSSEPMWLREALLTARRGLVVHRATTHDMQFHITMCLRVLCDALVSRSRAILQAKGLWLEQTYNDIKLKCSPGKMFSKNCLDHVI